jgi:hypothetical protein
MHKSSRSLTRFLLIFTLFIFLLGITGCSTIQALLRSSSAGSASVVFKVTGVGGQAYITYTRVDGSVTEPTKVSLPWRSPTLTFPPSSLLVLTAAGPPESGGVECSIWVNNIEMVRNTADPSEDKATCAYITNR